MTLTPDGGDGPQTTNDRPNDGETLASPHGPSRRSFLRTTAAAIGGIALGQSGGGPQAPVDSFSEVYASANLRMQAAREGALEGAGTIFSAHSRIVAGESTAAFEVSGMESVAQTVRQQTLAAEAAKSEILETYMRETGVKVVPLNNGINPTIQNANQAVASVKKTVRDDVRAIEDLKRQVREIETQRAEEKESYEKSCADLRTLLIEPEHIRVVNATLGSTPRYVVTTINHSRDTDTDTHRGRKAVLQNLSVDLADYSLPANAAPGIKSERWVIRKPKGPLKSVLAEAANLGE